MGVATKDLIKLPVLALCLLLGACVSQTNAPARVINLEKAERTHVQAGLRYLQQEAKDDARRHFRKAIELNSKSAGGHNGMALVYKIENDAKLADSHFKKAISADPTYTLARNNYGVFLFDQGRYSDARKQFETAAEDVRYGRRQYAMVNLGRTLLKLNERDAAMDSFKRALGIQLRLPQAHLEIADMYLQDREYVSSKYYFDQFSKYSQQSARSLWLGVRLERFFGNKDQEASYALALKNLFPYSQEYVEYKQSQK